MNLNSLITSKYVEQCRPKCLLLDFWLLHEVRRSGAMQCRWLDCISEYTTNREKVFFAKWHAISLSIGHWNTICRRYISENQEIVMCIRFSPLPLNRKAKVWRETRTPPNLLFVCFRMTDWDLQCDEMFWSYHSKRHICTGFLPNVLWLEETSRPLLPTLTQDPEQHFWFLIRNATLVHWSNNQKFMNWNTRIPLKTSLNRDSSSTGASRERSLLNVTRPVFCHVILIEQRAKISNALRGIIPLNFVLKEGRRYYPSSGLNVKFQRLKQIVSGPKPWRLDQHAHDRNTMFGPFVDDAGRHLNRLSFVEWSVSSFGCLHHSFGKETLSGMSPMTKDSGSSTHGTGNRYATMVFMTFRFVWGSFRIYNTVPSYQSGWQTSGRQKPWFVQEKLGLAKEHRRVGELSAVPNEKFFQGISFTKTTQISPYLGSGSFPRPRFIPPRIRICMKRDASPRSPNVKRKHNQIG